MITVEGLRKQFKQIVAVDDVSFRAENGSVTGLLGPNGAGKTTTLRMLYGLIQPDRGAVKIDGLDVTRDPLAAQRAIGVLPDARGLYPRLTSREHIRYCGELHGLGGAALEARIETLLEVLDMKTIADRRTEGFSHGERMKVAIARALVHQPNNVLLDEPTNGLDVMSTRAIRRLIQQLRGEGKCVVFSSHVMQEVAAVCDRIVVVARGRVVADHTPDELRARTGKESLEEAFVSVLGSDEGLMS
jgi:sodium transport system ATP-binding protein